MHLSLIPFLSSCFERFHLRFFFTNIFTNDNTVLSFTIHSCAISSNYYGKKKTDTHASRKLETRRKETADKENERERKRGKKDGESAVGEAQIERQQKGECIM